MQTLPYQNTQTEYRNESTQKPPREVIAVREASAEHIIQAARNNIATVWHGDFHNAKQVLSAIKKRAQPKPKTETDPATAFHKHRLAQSQTARLVNMLLVEIHADFMLDLPRSPNVQAALRDVYGEPNTQTFLLPLNQLLGFIGAHEWHKKGVAIPELGGNIHVPFGVFSPIRGEYLSLLFQAALPENCEIAHDIGTGSGVIAAILAKRGVKNIIATDNNPRAINCARENIARLGFTKQVSVLEQDLFPETQADLIVCNPPWLPAKPTSAVETALYDPEHSMLRAFLRGAATHLRENGQVWLIISDLAVHLGLRGADDLAAWFDEYGWTISGNLKTTPQHGKARDMRDPLAFARSQEITYLYVLKRK
ncbi:methyltransferase [Kingella negevensis]|uniref:methyltransferase n=1 Tax=Kingella negevensis TaxID=1522312 RepID=UPI00050A21F2|nr:class I SAM-dependent methyltransferase [Kingella negevensis]MDK4688181.1 class I SAM-dependent methyltransferase [Kingella negevensis]WII90834.1 class I SAM-dependent methyltransferase [Kingella negevensis]